MGGSRRRWRRQEAEPTRLDTLLGDPETVHAARYAFALAEQDPDVPVWPFVASVGPEAVALRWIGAAPPEPPAPWRAGHDGRMWLADRADLAAVAADARLSAVGGTAVLVGWFEETVVFVNTSRAPGPIVVEGDTDEVGPLRELIAYQTQGQQARALPQPRTPLDDGGAWWPMEVRDSAIHLFGLGVARTFTEDESRRAIEVVRLVTALDAARRTQAQPEPDTRETDELENWLTQVKQTATQAEIEARAARVTVEDVETEAQTSVGQADSAIDDPEDYDDLDSWATGFADSGADEPADP